jgi:hypothetical protein
MRREMKGKVLFLPTALALWTAACYSFLFLLGRLGVDPVVFVANPSRPEFVAHGMPQLSLAGALSWIGVLALYAAGSVLLAARTFDSFRGRRPFLGFLVLFLLSASYVTLVHPTLLLTVLSPQTRSAYSRFVEAYVPFLNQIYFHWGLVHLKLFVLLGQILITAVIVIAFACGSSRSEHRV